MSTTTMTEETPVTAPAPAHTAPVLAVDLAQTAPEPAGASATDPAIRTFRGRTLEELLPQIREQLGPDAIVVRQRDGLMGGIGGFFQQRFVEVDAKRGEPAHPHPRIDVYDEPPATAESFAQLLADAEEHADPIVTAAAFAPPIGQSEPVLPSVALPAAEPPVTEPASAAPVALPTEPATPTAPTAAAPPTEPTAQPELGVAADSLPAALARAGLSAAFAERLLADAEAHELPFTAGDHRLALRRALARRIPTALPHRAGGLAVAFAGAGSTSCADALASTYVRAGRRAHAVATIEQARTRLERAAPDTVVALDLPPIPDERAAVAELAQRLDAIELDETLIVVPAGIDLAAAHALRDRLAPLAPTGIALGCDDPHQPIGAAVELACATRLPLVYVLDGTIAPADPAAIAERLLP